MPYSRGNNERSTVPVGAITSLEEPSTEPILVEEDLPTLGHLTLLLDDFLMDKKRQMGRLNPYVQKMFYNPEHECYHVWLKYHTPIPIPSINTMKQVTKEMEELAELYRPHFKNGVVVSLQLN